MSKYTIARMIDKFTNYKVTGIEKGLGSALRDVDGVLLDFSSPFGYETVGKVIYKGPSYKYTQDAMRLNARKKFVSKNEQNIKIYGFVSFKYAYIMIYSLKSDMVTFKVSRGGRLLHTETRPLIDIKEYAKEFELRG